MARELSYACGLRGRTGEALVRELSELFAFGGRSGGPMTARKLSYACGFWCRSGEPFWIRKLSFTLVQVGSTLGLVDSKASSEQGDLLFLLVLSIVTMGVDRTFQLEAL
jgi:hypothetical protein